MLRTGRVVATEEGQVSVCFERPEACARCGACAGGKHHTVVRVPGQAPVGSWVDVEMPDHQVVKASALAYVLPLLALLAGVLVGSLLFESEALWALAGLIFMGLSWAALRLIDRRMEKKQDWQPRITAIHEEGEENHGNEADKG